MEDIYDKLNKRYKLNEIKNLFTSFILVCVFSLLFSWLTVVSANDGCIVRNEKAQIDFSGSNGTGVVKINVLSSLDKRVKVTIEKDDAKYTYDLKNDMTPETYPLQLGNGEYRIKVWVNAGASSYALALSAKYDAEFADPLAPFLNPSQYINFNKASKVVEKADELTKNHVYDIGKVEEIYNFVINSLTYDTQKAETAANGKLSGYLPSLDVVMDSGKGICFDYAAVFAAMLRSQGIPAKLVTGYVKPNNAYHAWNEFYLKDGGGWFKTNEMKFDGKKFERIDPTFDSTSKSSKKVLQFIGDGSNYIKFQEY